MEEEKSIEEQNVEPTNNQHKNKKPLLIIILIIAILLIGIISWIVVAKPFDKSNKKSNTEETQEHDKEENNANKEVNFKDKSDEFKLLYNEINSKLNSYLNTGIETYLVKCKDVSTDEPKTENSLLKAKNESIKMLLDKLITVGSIEEATFSFMGCSRNNITYIIGNNIMDAKVKLYYADAEDTLLIGLDKKGYALKFNDANVINGFIESLGYDNNSNIEKNPDEILKEELIKKFTKIGFTSDRAYFNSTDNLITVCGNNNFWITSKKFTANDLSKEQLIQTAINNIDLSKANTYEGRYEGFYSLNDINASLGKIVNNKIVSLDDIKNNYKNDYEKLEVNGNEIKLVYPFEKECWVGLHTYGNIEKLSKNNDKVEISLKVAYCEDYELEKGSYGQKCYKDSNKTNLVQDLAESYPQVKTWDKYDTYKITFNAVNGNYYFDSYELVN